MNGEQHPAGSPQCSSSIEIFVGGDAAERERHCKTIELYVPISLERIIKRKEVDREKGKIAILTDWQKFHWKQIRAASLEKKKQKLHARYRSHLVDHFGNKMTIYKTNANVWPCPSRNPDLQYADHVTKNSKLFLNCFRIEKKWFVKKKRWIDQQHVLRK